MKAKKQKLIPPDVNQCQRNFVEGCWSDAEHFMVIGPKKTRRCENKPVVIVYENKPDPKDGLKGSMSLCADCLNYFKEKMPKDFATIKPIAALKLMPHEALAKFVEDEVLPMLEFCGYGGKNKRREDSHVRQLKKRLEAIRGKAVQS